MVAVGVSTGIQLALLSGAAAVFTPAALFTGSDNGLVSDTSDLSTMYQDSAGVTAAVVGQPVGVLLDKRLGLVRGAQRLTGAGVKADGGTTPSVSTWDGSRLVITTPGVGLWPRITFPSPAKVVGTFYEVTFDYVVNSGTFTLSNIYDGSATPTVNKALTGSGTFRAQYVAAGTTGSEVLYMGNTACDVTLTNISYRELLGNHATQATTSAKPVLRQSGAKYRLEDDLVDDVLNARFPVALGAACTVIYWNGSAVVTLTAQTIGTTYDILLAQFVGRILIINRALTAGETTAVETWAAA